MILRRVSPIVRHFSTADAVTLRALSRRAWIAGRDGSVAQSGGTGGSSLCPWTGATIASGGICSAYVGVPGIGTLRLFHAQGARTNLFLNSNAPATQDVTVGTGSVTVSAVGSGYTLTTSAGTATGSGFGAVTMGTPQVLTISGAGTVTLTVSGTPVGGYVNVEQAAFAGIKVITAGSTVTRTADNIVWTLPAALPQLCDIFHIGCQPYFDGDMGVASQTWFISTDRDTRIDRTAATTLRVGGYDSTPTTVQDSITRTIPNKGVAFLQRAKFTSNSVEAGYGTSVSGSPTTLTTAPWLWASANTYRIGTSGTAGRESYAANGVIIVPGGATDAEVAALARAVHLRNLAVLG